MEEAFNNLAAKSMRKALLNFELKPWLTDNEWTNQMLICIQITSNEPSANRSDSRGTQLGGVL